MIDLPPDLATALENELRHISSKSLAGTAGALSERYRTGHARSDQPFVQSQLDIAAYAAHRLPATYAAIRAALAEVRATLPHWQPRTMLDLGGGPGTAMWAATAIWPGLESSMLLEREDRMIVFGKQLAAHAQSPAVRQATWRQVNLTVGWESHPADLSIAAYMLGEIPLSKHETLIDKLWATTAGTLVLIEPGTPRGFALIRRAREQLLAAGANVAAPCPHNGTCPMPENDWCHFAQRIARTRLQRTVKQGTLGYEDEKFSYVALTREPVAPIAGRVLRHPQIRPGHIELEVCMPEGIQRQVVTRSKKEAFRQARNLHWGSVLKDNSR